jgi:hypothetical protein
MVIDQTSHFNGNTETGNKYAPVLSEFTGEGDVKLTSAKIDTAYDNVGLARTIAMIEDDAFEYPIIIDLSEAYADTLHSYDLPFHYNGHLVETNFEVKADPLSRTPLGTDDGYQYLWKTAEAAPLNGLSQITWLLDRRFYTVSSSVPVGTKIVFTQIGANDPNFNLRNESGFMLRAETNNGVSFVSIIEPHGEYNPTVEYTLGSHSQVKSVSYFEADKNKFIQIETKDGELVGLGISTDPGASKEHNIEVNDIVMSWKGPFKLFHSEEHKKGIQ